MMSGLFDKLFTAQTIFFNRKCNLYSIIFSDNVLNVLTAGIMIVCMFACEILKEKIS